MDHPNHSTSTNEGDLSEIGIVFQGTHMNKPTLNFFTKEASRTKSPLKDLADVLFRILLPIDAEKKRRMLLSSTHRKIEGACDWILENDLFCKWKSAEEVPTLIWIEGGEGMGKTTLAIFLSEHLQQNSKRRPSGESCVLYHFCDRESAYSRDAAAILKSFIYQLCKQRNELAEAFCAEYSQSKVTYVPDHVVLLWKHFRDLMKMQLIPRIFCVIDGLNECENLALTDFLHELDDFFTTNRQQNSTKDSTWPETRMQSSSDQERQTTDMRMIILSREEPKCVPATLARFPRLSLKSEVSAGRQNDIDKLIDVRVNEISLNCPKRSDGNTQTSQLFETALRSRQPQNFQWVNLAADRYMSLKPSQIKSYLKEMPRSIEDMHLQTLLQIPARQRPYASAILKWVALAARPLSTLELVKAVKCHTGKSFSKKALEKSLGFCHGLLHRHGRGVTLASQSVEDLLFGKSSPVRRERNLKSSFAFEKTDVHSELTNTCVAYLGETKNLTKSRRIRLKPIDILKPEDAAFFQRHPFLEYVMTHWMFHAKHGTPQKTNYDSTFFRKTSARRNLWWKSYWMSLQSNFVRKWTAPVNFSLLHFAAYFDIVPLALHIEETGQILELVAAKDSYKKRPLHWATERTQNAMIKFLLERGDFDDGTLRQAARMGDIPVITMLVENRARALRSAYSSPRTPASPFQCLTRANFSPLAGVSRMLNSGVPAQTIFRSPDDMGYGKARSETALHIAATHGHNQAIEVLLSSGEDFHKSTDGGWTPLHNAAWFGHAAIVKRLIDKGADPESRTRDHLTPLHCAAKNSQRSVLENLLRESLVNIEAVDKFGLTPFHMACKSHDADIMGSLLDHGADLERKMRHGYTPLLWACSNGNFATVQFLLQRGADIEATWIPFTTETKGVVELGPVGVAKAYKHDSIATLVARSGAKDCSRVIDDDKAKLPSAQAEDEVYELPENRDVLLIQPEANDTAQILSEVEDEGWAEDDCGSEGDSDMETDVSEGSCDDDDESENDETTQSEVLGLGIEHTLNDWAQIDCEQTESPKAYEDAGVLNESQHEAGIKDICLGNEEMGAHALDDCQKDDKTETDVTEDVLKSQNSAEPRRSSAVSRPSGFFGEQLSRLMSKTAKDGGTSTYESAESLSLCTTSNAVGDGERIVEIARRDSDSTSPFAGRFRLYGTKKKFSWKTDVAEEDKTGSSSAVGTSNVPEGAEDACEGRKFSGSNVCGSDEAQYATKAPVMSQSPILGRFGAVRLRSWKLGSSAGDSAPAASQNPAEANDES